MKDPETVFRRALLSGAVVCWAASTTLSVLIINKTIDQVAHPGIGLIVFLIQGLAITLTIVWAQFRFRRVMVEVLKAGIELGQNAEKAPTPPKGSEGDYSD